MPDEAQVQQPARRRKWATPMVLISGLLLASFVVYQAFAYRGFISSLAEWQFGRIDTYYPMATLLVLLAIFALVVWLVVSIDRRRQRTTPPEQERVFRNGQRLAGGLNAIAVMLGVASVLTLALMLFSVPSAGAPFAVTVGSAVPTPDGTAADLRGLVRYDRLSRLRQNVLLFGRTNYYAPVEPLSGAAPGDGVAYFVERTDAAAGPPRVETNRGLLRTGALPGEIAHMYRNAGIAISPEASLLQPSGAHARWPFLVLALQFALLAIIFAAFAYYERRRLKRTIERSDELRERELAQAQETEAAPSSASAVTT